MRFGHLGFGFPLTAPAASCCTPGWHSFRFEALIAHLLPSSEESRLLKTLQEFLQLPALQERETFTQAANGIAQALSCEKVDVFLIEESKQTLRAVGTSRTPMGRLQHDVGLDTLALANGGSVVRVFKNGGSELQTDTRNDPEELRGVVGELGVRSSIAVAFEVGGVRRGVLSTMSKQPGFFQAADREFVQVMAQCVGVLVQREEEVGRARRVEADQARRAAADEIITVLAHDFRNHLQPLVGRLQTMRLYHAHGKPLSVADIDGAIRAADRLTRLTNDLLDLKRLDEGLFTLNLQPVDLVALARETAAAFASATRPVDVSGLPDLTVVADPDRVRQVLDNLVANSVKHTSAGTVIQLRVNLRQDGGQEQAVLEVVDKGKGIAEHILPTLFERYVSGAASHGLGLGLHLARHIARLHGGDVSVASQTGVGTTFTVVMPLEAASTSNRVLEKSED